MTETKDADRQNTHDSQDRDHQNRNALQGACNQRNHHRPPRNNSANTMTTAQTKTALQIAASDPIVLKLRQLRLELYAAENAATAIPDKDPRFKAANAKANHIQRRFNQLAMQVWCKPDKTEVEIIACVEIALSWSDASWSNLDSPCWTARSLAQLLFGLAQHAGVPILHGSTLAAQQQLIAKSKRDMRGVLRRTAA